MTNYSYTTSSNTTCSTDATWNYWIQSGTCATATVSVNATWTTWNIVKQDTRSISEEEQRNRTERAAEEQKRWKLENEEAARKDKERTEKARLLLRELLSAEQNAQLDKEGFFELTSVNSGNIYRVSKGRSRNIKLLDKDRKVIQTLCFHPTEYVHDYNTMAAQKLLLEHNEEEVKKVANYS